MWGVTVVRKEFAEANDEYPFEGLGNWDIGLNDVNVIWMTRSFQSKNKKIIEVNFNIYYITQYIQNIAILTCNQYKILSTG